MGDVDYPFLMAVILLLAFGLVMLFSAGSAKAFSNFGDSLWYFKKQLFGAVLGVVGMIVLARFDYHRLGKFSFGLLLLSGILLVMVLIPGLGTTTNGSTRWLFGFQPSEIAKFAVILFFAFSLSKNQKMLPDFLRGFCPYLAVLGVFVILLALEPHFSCIVLMGLSSCLILYVAGAKIKHFLIVGFPAVIGAVFMVVKEPYRMARVVSFLDPFADAQGDGWQIVQSLYAIGSGGIFGVGLGQSRQKYQSLPEPHNDFIFSVLAEELGLLGAIILIALFIFLIVRGIKIAAKAPDLFGTLLVTGIVGIVAFQALINIAVVTSSVPVTGMPLPFFSYGSTALCITMAEMGIVLNVSRQSHAPL
ncbi:putative lipid II flippase FtsW [Oscillospiraceae bacterium DSM 107454]|uniref:Probable peptidoglycan glycosyltransferase FtsW n=2 Tax=Ructibacterium gallinarum TaxID=2779355 RepID=A0A9D5LXW2_9FIRM|nr:putative lipid II flippase FtsW [Ructibacterium gallinarum]